MDYSTKSAHEKFHPRAHASSACPRRDSKGVRIAKARARAHALATLLYKQATGLFALRSARSREFGVYKKGPHRWGPCCSDGARGETRTRTMSPPVDFESTASANSATRAHAMVLLQLYHIKRSPKGSCKLFSLRRALRRKKPRFRFSTCGKTKPGPCEERL